MSAEDVPPKASTPLSEIVERAPSREVLVRPRTLLMAAATLLAVALAVLVVRMAMQVITWMLIAAFLAVALDPAVAALERRGLRRGLAVATVCTTALVVLGLLAWAVLPPLVRQTADLVQAVPGAIDDLSRGRGPLGSLQRDYDVVGRVRSALDGRGAGGLLGYTSPLLGFVRGVVTGVAATVTIAFLTVFMLLEGRRWVAVALDLVPVRSRPRWERTLSGIARTIGGYVTGNLLISLIAGVVAWALLAATGVPFALPIALLVAMLDLVPLVGATIGTVIAAGVALGQGWLPFFVVLGGLILYQQAENHLLQPLIYGRRVPLSPLAVLVSVLIGAEIAGVIGALVAIPIGGSIRIVVGELLAARRERMVLGDAAPPGGPDEPGRGRAAPALVIAGREGGEPGPGA